jgi:hypothetical protein
MSAGIKEGRKHFFFEKKKKKTFIPWPFAPHYRHRAGREMRDAME